MKLALLYAVVVLCCSISLSECSGAREYFTDFFDELPENFASAGLHMEPRLAETLKNFARWFPEPEGAKYMESKNEKPSGAFDFIPSTVGSLMAGSSLSYASECFGSISWSMELNSTDAVVTTTTKEHKGALCTDLFLISDREKGHFVIYDVGKTHTLTISDLSTTEYNDINAHGLRVFYWPLGIEDTLISIYNTVMLFLDPNPNMADNNVKFFADKMQWQMKERPTQYQNTAIDLKDSDIQSGDYFGVLRLDGLDPMIAWGTGGHTGHTTMALWFTENGQRELYVVESTDTPGPEFLTYWPPPYGIIRTPFQQWVQQALNASYHVDILRLSSHYSSRFNETAAQNWFFELQGMPYGWHTFMNSFLDTELYNLPVPVTPELFEIIFSFVDRLDSKDEGAKGSVYNLMVQSLNHQYGSSCTDLQCIFGVLDPLGVSLEAAVAKPINDTWLYGPFEPPYQPCDSGVNANCSYSFVCSSFVYSMYKAAGLFKPFTNEVQGVEQTPKDVYQMAIFEDKWDRPQVCVDADPALPFCQLMGKYVLTLPGYNTIPPYAHNNEHCSAAPPQYYRGPVGC